MMKRILLSTAVLLTLAATSWAQCSDCSSCDANSGGYIDDAAYSIDDGAYSIDDASYGESLEGCGCTSCNCGVSQGYFSAGDCGSGIDYKYARLFGGLGDVDDFSMFGQTAAFDDGWGIGGALGRRVGRRRTELELSYRHNSLDLLLGGTPFANGNLSTTAVMANMMFDLVKVGRSNVYAGGGIGALYGDAHLVSGGGFAVDDTTFAYQGIVGIDRDLRNGMRGFVEYRSLTAEFDFNGDFDYDAQNLFFGVEFRR